MSDAGLAAAVERMRDRDIDERAIRVFEHYYRELEAGSTGLIPESSIDPIGDVQALDDLDVTEQERAEALGRTAVVKLNGGLGTSMGLSCPKSVSRSATG